MLDHLLSNSLPSDKQFGFQLGNSTKEAIILAFSLGVPLKKPLFMPSAQTFPLASPNVRAQLYRSLVLSTLDYCAPLWSPQISLYRKMLEAVQHFAARIVTQSWSKETSVDYLTRSLNWTTLATWRKKKVTFCYHILNNQFTIPACFFTPEPSPHL